MTMMVEEYHNLEDIMYQEINLVSQESDIVGKCLERSFQP